MPRFKLRKKTKKEQAVAARRKRLTEETRDRENLFESHRVLSALGFAALVVVVVLICFAGLNTGVEKVSRGQKAQVRVSADFAYTYESQLQTRERRELVRKQVKPVFNRNDLLYKQFEARVHELEESLDALDITLRDAPEEKLEQALADFQEKFQRKSGIGIPVEDLRTLLEEATPQERRQYFEEGLIILRDIMRDGVFADEDLPERVNGQEDRFLGVSLGGRGTSADSRSLSTARDNLRQLLTALRTDTVAEREALTRVLLQGVQPNMVYDEEAHDLRIQNRLAEVEPVRVTVEEGETIVSPGEDWTAEDVEKYNAYLAALQERQEDLGLGLDMTFVERLLLSIGTLLAAFLYVKVSLPQLNRSPRRLGLLLLTLVLSLALMRAVLQVGATAYFETNVTVLTLIPHLVPVAFGPIVLTMMIGAAPAVLLALLVAIFNALMQGGSHEVLIVTFLSALVAVYLSREVRSRAKVVRAGLFSGLTAAASLMLVNLFAQFSPGMLFLQMAAAALTGVATAFLVIGLLPMLENTFKYVTDVTLLELTDYNHPLLRRMQLVAPGTYHHSLMVAQLSERAAAEISCNGLFCRAACLFHDIGKMVKPDYFIENQREGYNPHMEKNPSMSALIIKSHVKEGVEMARQAKLPPLIVEIIRQHHGTTLIKYFYHKAVEQQSQRSLPLAESANAAGLDGEAVDESSFRYDGPRPRFKESGIIFFADAVEAASRSLKKVTPQSVEELIENIFRERIEDHQLDLCPLTTKELKTLKKSFAFTMLNMLHSRVEYPSGKPGGTRAPTGRHKEKKPAAKAKETHEEQQAAAQAHPPRPVA